MFNNHRSNLGPVRLYAQPGAEQHCSRGPAGTDQRWRAATAGQVGCHTGGKNNTAAGTCHGGWRPEGGCTDFDVAAELLKRVLKSAGRTGETVERLSRERPSRRETPVADHYRTGPSRAVCVSILTIMDITSTQDHRTFHCIVEFGEHCILSGDSADERTYLRFFWNTVFLQRSRRRLAMQCDAWVGRFWVLALEPMVGTNNIDPRCVMC